MFIHAWTGSKERAVRKQTAKGLVLPTFRGEEANLETR